jgi:SAM-dependent methyltransferase
MVSPCNDSGAYRSWKGWEERDFGRVGEDAGYFMAEVRRSGAAVGPGTRVLEIGFGNGAFAVWATERGAEYVGTELDQELVLRAKRAGLNALHVSEASITLKREESFDSVFAWDVLEHVPRPALLPMLVELKEVMKPGAVLVARVPSGDSPFSGAIQTGDVTHQPALGSAAVRYIGMSAGFAAVEVKECAIPLWGCGFSALVRRSIVVLCDLCVHPPVRLLMRNPSAILTPNMIVVFRR